MMLIKWVHVSGTLLDMGFLDRFKGKRDDQPSPLVAVLSEAQLDELRETAREWIHPGFRSRFNLAEELADFRDDFEVEPNVVRRAAEAIVAEEWSTRLAEQETWLGDTDHARVARAFEGLAAHGIVARMNFTCCQTCGTDEIDDERTPLTEPGDGYPYREWGYTFFHQQDAERLADSPASLYLSYSVFAPAPALADELVARLDAGDEEAKRDVMTRSEVIVGTTVADALRAEGLDVDWDGSTESRIRVDISDWRKPLPTD